MPGRILAGKPIAARVSCPGRAATWVRVAVLSARSGVPLPREAALLRGHSHEGQPLRGGAPAAPKALETRPLAGQEAGGVWTRRARMLLGLALLLDQNQSCRAGMLQLRSWDAAGSRPAARVRALGSTRRRQPVRVAAAPPPTGRLPPLAPCWPPRGPPPDPAGAARRRL